MKKDAFVKYVIDSVQKETTKSCPFLLGRLKMKRHQTLSLNETESYVLTLLTPPPPAPVHASPRAPHAVQRGGDAAAARLDPRASHRVVPVVLVAVANVRRGLGGVIGRAVAAGVLLAVPHALDADDGAHACAAGLVHFALAGGEGKDVVPEKACERELKVFCRSES